MATIDAAAALRSRVFLSYSRADAAMAHWLRGCLEAAGIVVFRDLDDTLPGEEWWARLKDLIAQADTIVFLLSPLSATSRVCADEVAHALALNKRVFPALIGPVDWASVPEGLARVHSVDFQNESHLEQALMSLTSALGLDIAWIREHTRLLDRAIHWLVNDRDASELLNGDTLDEAERWLASRLPSAPGPTSLHLDYLKASRDAQRARHERRLREAEQQRHATQVERDRAERNLIAASATANDLTEEIATEFRYAPLRLNELVGRMLDRSQAMVDDLLQSGTSFPVVASNGIAGLLTISELRGALGDNEVALATAQQAVSAAHNLTERQPDDSATRILLAKALTAHADALTRTSETETALARYREVIASSASDAPADARWAGVTAAAWLGQGKACLQLAAFEEAIAAFGQATILARCLPAPPTIRSEDRFTLLSDALMLQSEALARSLRWDEAILVLHNAIEVCELTLRDQPNHKGALIASGDCQELLGDACNARSEYFDAFDAYYASCRLIETASGDNMSDDRWANPLARRQEKLGRVMRKESLLLSGHAESFDSMQLYQDLASAAGGEGKPKPGMKEIINSPETAIRRAKKFIQTRKGGNQLDVKLVIEGLVFERRQLKQPLSDAVAEQKRLRALRWIDRELAALQML